MRSEQENVLAEAAVSLRYLWRHRRGQEIPGAILDAIDNLPLQVKDGRRPVLAAKRRTPSGWHLVFNLPPGVSYNKMRRYREYFMDAANSWITMTWDGKLHMDVYAGRLPVSLPYEWQPEDYPKLALPVPIGVTQEGVEVLDMAEAPHLLVAGVPGYGKSNFLHVLIHSLLHRARIAVIDLKRLEFAYLGQHCALARNEAEALKLMQALDREMERRIDTLERAQVVKVQDYSGDMPFLVLVIDEVAEIRDEKIIYHVDRIVRLARAVGVSVVASTQRPSKKVKLFADDVRDMFAARLCYQVADEITSRMVLGETCPLAAQLPGIKGRGIYRFGLAEKEVQTMFLPLDQARELLRIHKRGGWHIEPATKRLPPR